MNQNSRASRIKEWGLAITPMVTRTARLAAALLILFLISRPIVDQVVSLTGANLVSSIPISHSHYEPAIEPSNVPAEPALTNVAVTALGTNAVISSQTMPRPNPDSAAVIRMALAAPKVWLVAIQLMACLALFGVSIWAIVSLLREE